MKIAEKYAIPIMKALVYTLIISAIILGVSTAAQAVDVEAFPAQLWWARDAIVAIRLVTATPAIAFVILFVRNIYGYFSAQAREYILTKKELLYSDVRYIKTAMLYIGTVTTFTLLLPAPYNMVGFAIVVVVDIAISIFKDFFGLVWDASETQPTATITIPPAA